MTESEQRAYDDGYAAGRARAIDECAGVCMEQEIPAIAEEIGLKPRSIYWQALTDCHAAIRALNATQPKE